MFPRHGPGTKHTRKIELAEWQQVIVDRYPGEFARPDVISVAKKEAVATVSFPS